MELNLCRPPFVALSEGAPCALAPREAVLCAWLAIEGTTRRERAATLLWPEVGADSALNSLRQLLFQMRQRVPGLLDISRSTLALADDTSHDLADAQALLEGLDLGIEGEMRAWLDHQRQRRRRDAALAHERAFDEAERRGDHESAARQALALVALDPCSEDAHRRLMRAHYLAGDRAAALLAFDRLERTLKHEVGTQPSAESLALLGVIERASTDAIAPRLVAASVLRPPRLIAREAEWATLEAAWLDHRVALVLGEAGLGKTRLTTDFVQSHGRVLGTCARPGDDRVVYSSLTRLLRGLGREVLDSLEPDVRRELARLLPELGAATPAESPGQLTRFSNAVASALASTPAGLDAILLDDLHFADDASIELFQYVASQTGLRWVIAGRPAEIGATGRAWIDAFDRTASAVRVVLRPLEVGQVQALLASLGLEELCGPATAQAMHARTGGNPMFVLELLKAGWRPARDGSLEPRSATPSPVQALIERRIGLLSPAAIQLARCAAVAAPDFSIDLATRVLGLRAIELADPLAELEAAQVLRDGSFAHDLIYESALASVPQLVARSLHAEVAAFLGERGGEPARVATHWLAAGDDRQALDALLEAAASARARMRRREEADLLLQAADIAERLGEPDVAFSALQHWMHAMRVVDRSGDRSAMYERWTRLATTPQKQIAAMLDHSGMHRLLGRLDESEQLTLHALALARDHGDADHEAQALLILASCLTYRGDVRGALVHQRAALPFILSSGTPQARQVFFNDFACCLDNADEPAEGERYHRMAIEASVEAGQLDHASMAETNFAIAQASCGRLEQAFATLQRARSHAIGLDAAQGIVWPIDALAFSVARDLQRFDEALRVGELAMIAAQQHPPTHAHVQNHFACLWLHLGQPARAGQALAAIGDKVGMPFTVARTAHLQGRLERALGRSGAEALARAAAIARSAGRSAIRLMIDLDRALLLDPDEALTLATAVREESLRIGLEGVALAAAARAALFAARAGEIDAALMFARTALATPDAISPNDLYGPEVTLNAAIALQAAGLDAEASALVGDAATALRRIARERLTPALRDAYLERNPVNRALLIWRR
ncbi:AAA family ATPase [soil metagenome]